MSWVTVKSVVLAITALSALLLFGIFNMFLGISASTPILNTSFNWGQLAGVACGYVFWAIWARYI